MRSRLVALPILALVFGAVDTLLVRWEFDHRPLQAPLFWQSALLWLAFGVLALVPASLAQRLVSRRRDGGPPGAREQAASVAWLAAWMAGPVLVHARVDRHTAIGGDVSGLLSLGALLDLLLGLAFVALLFFATRAAVARLGGLRLGAALALAALACGLFVGFRADTGGTGSSVAEAPAGPNVLLMVWDTTRSKNLSLYGYGRETTPFLDRVAETSLVFDRARSASSYTLTSHLSMLTGVYPSHHGARLRRQVFDPFATPSVAEDFARAGYRTGAFVGTGVLRAQTGAAWAFEHFDDLVDPPVSDTHAWALVHDLQAVLAATVPGMSFNGLPHWFQDFQRPARRVLENARAWIEEPDPRPWFCLINMYDVHWPYVPAPEARERWVRPYDGPADGYLKRSDRYRKEYKLRGPDRLHVRDLYDGEMWSLDREVEAFLAAIDLDRTAVVITSDHGEAFGEGGRWEHDDILECQVRVPLIVRPAGGIAGHRSDVPASGVDVAPTLLALAGLEPLAGEGPGPRFDGIDLLAADAHRSLLVEDRDHLDPLDVRLALYEGKWKLLRLGLGTGLTWELFDLEADPEGLSDVAADHPDVVEELKGRMEALRAAWGADDERDLLQGGDVNAEALEALGYAN